MFRFHKAKAANNSRGKAQVQPQTQTQTQAQGHGTSIQGNTNASQLPSSPKLNVANAHDISNTSRGVPMKRGHNGAGPFTTTKDSNVQQPHDIRDTDSESVSATSISASSSIGSGMAESTSGSSSPSRRGSHNTARGITPNTNAELHSHSHSHASPHARAKHGTAAASPACTPSTATMMTPGGRQRFLNVNLSLNMNVGIPFASSIATKRSVPRMTTAGASLSASDGTRRQKMLALLESEVYEENVHGIKQLIQMIHVELMNSNRLDSQRSRQQGARHLPTPANLFKAGKDRSDVRGHHTIALDDLYNSLSYQLFLGGSNTTDSSLHASGDNNNDDGDDCDNSLTKMRNMVGLSTNARSKQLQHSEDEFMDRLQLAVLSFFRQAVPSNIITITTPKNSETKNIVDTTPKQRNGVVVSTASNRNSNTSNDLADSGHSRMSELSITRSNSLDSDDGASLNGSIVSESSSVSMDSAGAGKNRERHADPTMGAAPMSGKHQGRLQLACLRALTSALQCLVMANGTYLATLVKHHEEGRSLSTKTEKTASKMPFQSLRQRSAFCEQLAECSALIMERTNPTTVMEMSFVCQCLRHMTKLEAKCLKASSSNSKAAHDGATADMDLPFLQWMQDCVLPDITHVKDTVMRGTSNGHSIHGGRMLIREADRLLKLVESFQ